MSRVAAARRPFLNLRLGAVALACTSALLASCGGGDRESYFTPDSVVSFGDENSAIAEGTGSSLLDQSGAATTLKGLVFTAQPVVVTAAAICAHDSTPKICGADAGGAFTMATEAYYILSSDYSSWVTRREVDAGPTLQRTSTVDYACSVATNWVQIVARSYGKGYTSKCPSDARGGAVNHAYLGAKTADVIAQINANRGALNSKTVVTIMVGQNDIIEQFESANTTDAAASELRLRADSMAAAIKGVIGLGAKVVLALTPDISQSPFAASNRARMETLVKAYNDRLYITGLGNVSGRSLAGVNPESYTKPGTMGSSYQTATPLCDASLVRRADGTTPADDNEKLLYCTSQHYASGTDVNTAMWADSKRAAPVLHSLIGVTVYNRAREQF